MQYDKTVGNVNIKVNTTRLDRNTMEAQKLLNIQVVEDSNNLIPFQQGALREAYAILRDFTGCNIMG